ncbi:50S ribosomal protein L25/general stress protein Ctc [Tessaracoccus sp. OS52]|uniref:50S ribosomal protein L25/general stress protein Ctc n=1 Tax=Tessaracoccus sp. OS52 TaxID=2886691 RepID=UPI001D10772E|nr:50S ribosomal protein L25/general stress protein Ctc [Tessaracoccus sp. OS52]
MAKPQTTQLNASTRTEFGKGAARRTRRAGQIPAVLYGHGTDPVHIALPGQETFLALRQANVLLDIAVDGAKNLMALPKQVQRDPITHAVEHVDLLIVTAGEKVSVEVALIVTGEAERGSLVNHDLNTLTVEAPATAIPNEIEVSVEGLVIGDQILVKDLVLPEGVSTHVDPEALVVNVTQPQVVDLEVPSSDEDAVGAAGQEEAEDEASEEA